MGGRYQSLTDLSESFLQHRKYEGDQKGDNSDRIRKMKLVLKTVIDEELTVCQREAVSMYYFEGLKTTEIAGILHINRSSVSRRLKRSREKIKKILSYGLI